MRRRLQVLAVCAAFLLAMHLMLMAQDTGGAGGGGGADNSGATGSPDTSGGADNGNDNSGNMQGGGNNSGATPAPAPTPAPGAGDQGQEGNGTMPEIPEGGETPAPGGTEGAGEGSTIVPPTGPTGLPPGAAVPVPGATPSPTPIIPNFNTGGTQGAAQPPPITFTAPEAGYGNPGSQSFTLGEGRLSKPPVTFSLSLSMGYDTNIFNAPSHPTPTPTPGPTPPLVEQFTGIFRISPPLPPTPIFRLVRAKAVATPTPVATLGIIGSPVATATVGVQVQRGTPRTLFTMDLSVGEQEYFDQPGNGTDYTGNFDLNFIHKISPRATLSMEAFAVYQNTPNFALINAPTNNNGNNGGSYLNGDIKADLTYAWGARISTVTSGEVNFNLLESNNQNNFYQLTYGTQFRYTVSPRNSVTAEIRDSSSIYPTNSSAGNTSLFYLLGLDTVLSAKLRNTVDGGLEVQSFSGSGSGQTIPYMETATTLALPHQGSLSWTNRYGSEETGNSAQTATSYRTGLTIALPVSTKLVASFSLAYNYVLTKDPTDPAGASTQKQAQFSLSLGYTVSPRLSLSLSYTYIDLLSTAANSSYVRNQIFLGGSYTFR